MQTWNDELKQASIRVFWQLDPREIEMVFAKMSDPFRIIFLGQGQKVLPI
jgi:hypothetical protein